MNATLQVVAKDVTTIKDTTKELKDSVEDIKVRLGEAEQRISDIEDASALIEAKVDKCEERLEVLWSRVEDLENRSRRNNVRIIRFKEGVEEPGKLDQYVTEILDKAFELSGSEFEIERLPGRYLSAFYVHLPGRKYCEWPERNGGSTGKALSFPSLRMLRGSWRRREKRSTRRRSVSESYK